MLVPVLLFGFKALSLESVVLSREAERLLGLSMHPCDQLVSAWGAGPIQPTTRNHRACFAGVQSVGARHLLPNLAHR